MINNSRLVGDKIDIDYDQVKKFFQQRGDNINCEHIYTSILYQDNNPELAEERDLYEKKIILPLLRLNGKNNVLDIGCGIGRWADSICEKVNYYHGTDFSESLINVARSRYRKNNIQFQVLPAEEIKRNNISYEGSFDRVIIAGLLLYMNDNQIKKMLEGLSEIISGKCIIYMREPIGIEHRLTLKNYWSEELQSFYSAIYRKKNEIIHLTDQFFKKNHLKIIKFEPLYKDAKLDNREETIQYFILLEREG
jgi:2-polyprenyl-3-methyl-5-hydroxy-6-metoxy-1,4-benzoquinol methylase